MDKKITQLTQVTELTGAELLPLAQGGVTKSASVDQLRGYKVYTALLTQSGGDNPSPVYWDEYLIKGVTYEIISLAVGDDVTQYGAPNNNVGTKFVSNQDVNVWGSSGSELAYNTGAPVVTVLENTIGNIWWTYNSFGNYYANSGGLFTLNKTLFEPRSFNDLSDKNKLLYAGGYNQNLIAISCFNFQGDTVEEANTGEVVPIEIRVYN